AAEEFAVQLYSDATVVDGYPGDYPPDDTGSSGLAICKVLKSRGTINGYRWARTAYGFLRLLQRGPVLQGMPWYNAFFTPDRQGFIDSDANWPSSGVAGGHEIEAVAVELDTTDAFSSVITYVNSWGSNWGDSGRFRVRLRTYQQLNGVDLQQDRMGRRHPIPGWPTTSAGPGAAAAPPALVEGGDETLGRPAVPGLLDDFGQARRRRGRQVDAHTTDPLSQCRGSNAAGSCVTYASTSTGSTNTCRRGPSGGAGAQSLRRAPDGAACEGRPPG